MREFDDVFEPERLEPQLGAQLAQLGLQRVVHHGARHNGDRRVAVFVRRAKAVEEAEAVDERHAQVEDDRVGVG